MGARGRKWSAESLMKHRKRTIAIFWGHVAKSDGCWEWTGIRTVAGYGRCGKGGVRAHRVSYELTYGPIPDMMHVLHRCDNPPCVNPNHLFLGAQADNMRDMAQKGRARGGAAAGLDSAAVETARALHASGMSFSAIATRVGSTHTTVARAVRRQGRHYAGA
jgi:HNH endonuclease/Helix-turn-helix domain